MGGESCTCTLPPEGGIALLMAGLSESSGTFDTDRFGSNFLDPAFLAEQWLWATL